jgi:hypothetical protein
MEIEDFGDIGDIDLGPLWLRRISWDALPCDMVEEVQQRLGLTPAGDDQQADRDHAASHARIALIEDLSQAVDYLSPFVSQVLTEAIIVQMGHIDLTDELKKKLIGQNQEIIRSATSVMLAQFIATGVLTHVETKK